MTTRKPDPALAAIDRELDQLERTAEDYTPDLTPDAPGAAPIATPGGAWRPNPQRIAAFQPRLAMIYAVGCGKWSEATSCPPLQASAEELDAVSRALAEILDAALPESDGQPTRMGTIAAAGFTVGGIVVMKMGTLEAYKRAQQAAQQAAGGGDDSQG